MSTVHSTKKKTLKGLIWGLRGVVTFNNNDGLESFNGIQMVHFIFTIVMIVLYANTCSKPVVYERHLSFVMGNYFKYNDTPNNFYEILTKRW